MAHRFDYPASLLMLPMRTLRERPAAALPRNRFGWMSFHDRDHGDGREDSLAWLDELLARHGIDDARGEVWLHCFPRVLGWAFKPVSFWYAERRDRSLAAIVVEVNNTFGQRHCYLFDGDTLAYGRELRADKALHVSPFNQVSGSYRFLFWRDARRTLVRIDHDDPDGALLRTSVSGALQPLTAARMRRAVLAMPLLGLGVIVRIHWQALKLFIKGLPVHRTPSPPTDFVTRHPC
jgi:DUF1365 family protein